MRTERNIGVRLVFGLGIVLGLGLGQPVHGSSVIASVAKVGPLAT